MIDPRLIRQELSERLLRIKQARDQAQPKRKHQVDLTSVNESLQTKAYAIASLTSSQAWPYLESWLLDRANPFKAVTSTKDTYKIDNNALIYAKCADDLLTWLADLTKLAQSIKQKEVSDV